MSLESANRKTTVSPPRGRASVSPPRGRKTNRHSTLMNLNTSSDFHISSSGIKTNSKGGILVTQEELQCAFNFLDVDKQGKITIANLKKSLSIFFPDLPLKELKFLMNNKKEITVEDLSNLLVNNEITNFDPIAEAFKVYDPMGSGRIDPQILNEIFSNFGLGQLNHNEIDLLTKISDVDGDGVVSVEDFRQLLSSTRNHASRIGGTLSFKPSVDIQSLPLEEGDNESNEKNDENKQVSNNQST